MNLHILGIRHHGPGSSTHLLRALAHIAPDLILVEGPAEANTLIPFIHQTTLEPPVAIIVYEENNPQKAVFFPFAEFSPEWQALLYANTNQIAARFADLPQANQFVLGEEKETNTLKRDPFRLLTTAAGFSDTERWWEHFIEKKTNSEAIFESLLEMMQEIRNFEPEEDHATLLREAYMRQAIFNAQKEGFQNVVFVCGAWHSPALLSWQTEAKNDAQTLKKLPKTKTLATWIPWTYPKMAFQAGYRAGINSPMWYECIWKNQQKSDEIWMIQAANLLRKNGFDTSSSAVIEAVRLAGMLAFMREMHIAGLEELKDAAKTVLCNGDEEPLKLIENELIIGNKIGKISEKIPLIPLQQDFYKNAKMLRIALKANETVLSLDLRSELHRAKSVFLHRLNLLFVPFAYNKQLYNKLGTFHEEWLLKWNPQSEIMLIEGNVWGNTVYAAALSRTMNELKKVDGIAEITEILSKILHADLKGDVQLALETLNNATAMHHDVGELMRAVPPLVRIVRYGDVRGTDTEYVDKTLKHIVSRVFVGLPSAVYQISEENAGQYFQRIEDFHQALLIWDNNLSEWLAVLKNIAFNNGTQAYIAGQAARIIFDHETISKDEMLVLVSYKLSFVEDLQLNSFWLEGFMGTKAQILLYDDELWKVVNDWVEGMIEGDFINALPLFRRIFANLDENEKVKLIEKLKGNENFKPLLEETDEHFEKRWETAQVFISKVIALNKASLFSL